MYADRDAYKKYQREWQKLWRKKHPKARDRYQRYHNQGEVRPITSIIKLSEFNKNELLGVSNRMSKITDLGKKKHLFKVNRKPTDKNRCPVCGIKIGKSFIEKKRFIMPLYRGKRVVCGTCFNDLSKMTLSDRNKYFKKKSYYFMREQSYLTKKMGNQDTFL